MGREVRKLVDYPFAVVRVACRFCPHRIKGYKLARLAARAGPDIELQVLIDLLECGRGRPAKVRKVQSFCGVYYLDLHSEPLPEGAPLNVPERLFVKAKRDRNLRQSEVANPVYDRPS
ncbi:hypothetical protein ABLE91_05910 [Aquabacter sp. CN5-332]|uniref:hypothetical protein n=1 Tax=Aquabacter sp. CN5-332 TaxID=3156608 RepID=UPI0032B54331